MAFRTLLLSFSCLFALIQGQSLSAQDDIVLFSEGFENGAEGWSNLVSDNNRTMNEWAVQKADDAPEGQSIARFSTFGAYGCERGEKAYVSPAVAYNGAETMVVTFAFRYMEENGESLGPNNFSVLAYNTSGMPFWGENVNAANILPSCDNWRRVQVRIDPTGPIPDFFHIGFRFQSSSGTCDEIQVDDVKLLEVNGNKPQTGIVKPEPNRRGIYRPGDRIELEARSDAVNARFTWKIFRFATEYACLTGKETTFTPQETGHYTVFVSSMDQNGIADDSPARRELWVSNIEKLDTEIYAPAQKMVRMLVGQERSFSARVKEMTPNKVDDEIGFAWELVGGDSGRNVTKFNGDTITFKLTEPGHYELSAAATEGAPILPRVRRDHSPARLKIEVTEVLAMITKPTAKGRIPEIVIEDDKPVQLEGEVDDPFGKVATITWSVVETGETLCSNATVCTYEPKPNEQGIRTIVFTAMDKDEVVLDTAGVRLLVDVPLNISAISDRRVEAPVSTPFSINTEVRGTLADDPNTEIFWVYKGQVKDAGEVFEVDGIDLVGTYSVRIVARNRAANVSAEKRFEVVIHNPDDTGRAKIIAPQSDWRITSGETLFFDSSMPLLPGDKANAYWEIVDEETGDVFISSNQKTLGNITFTEEDTYLANLYIATDAGQQLVDTKKLWVAETHNKDFESNTAIDNATFVENGTYANLALDRDHYYSIEVKEHQTIRVWIETGENGVADVVFEKQDGEILEIPVKETKYLQIAGLPAGNYRWGVRQPEGQTKSGLSFNFGVSVLNPALYFTDISVDAGDTTEIGVVNTTGESTDLEIIAYNAAGNQLASISRTLAGKGHLREDVSTLFSEQDGQVSWIRVDSTNTVVGFSRTVSSDKAEAFAVNAANFLESELYVPHIAQDTNTWQTQANVVNGLNQSINAGLTAGSIIQGVDNSTSYSKSNVNFKDAFGGSVPADATWGVFFDQTGTAGLAGNEIFKTVDGSRQSVGLGLFGAPADNPNFTTQTDNLYFTHITQSDGFWTGIALVNLADFNYDILVKAYGEGGVEIGSGTINLGVAEKQVWEVNSFLRAAGIEGEALWMELVTEGNVVGYELFGTTTDVKSLAGLEATSEPKTSICMPYVDATGEHAHGIAVVNTANVANALTITMRNDLGEAIREPIAIELKGKEKELFTLTSLFGELPLNGAWVEIDADEPIVGFQLILRSDGSNMSGILAQ